MSDTLIKEFQKLEFLKQNPELLVLLVCIIAFIFSAKPILDFLDSGYTFFNRVRYQKYLQCKEILDSPLASQEHKNLALSEINRFHFMQLKGINTKDEQLRHNLVLFAKQAKNQNIWVYIRNSIKYLSAVDNNTLIEIRPEGQWDKIYRCFCYIIAFCCFLLFMLCLSIYVFLPIDAKLSIFLIICMMVFFISTIYAISQTDYIYAIKKIKEEKENIQQR